MVVGGIRKKTIYIYIISWLFINKVLYFSALFSFLFWSSSVCWQIPRPGGAEESPAGLAATGDTAGQSLMWPKVGNCRSQEDLMEIYSIIENLEEDYDDNELIEALADVLMDRQEKVEQSVLLTQ